LLVAEVDFAGHLRSLTPHWESVFGVAPDSLVGRPWRDFAHPSDLDGIAAELGRLVERAADVVEFEARVHLPGRATWHILRCCVVADHASRMLHVVCADQTERQREARLLDRTARAGRIAGWELDSGDASMHWTTSMYDVLGLPAGSPPLALYDLFDVFAPAGKAALREAVLGSIASGQGFELEVALANPVDGRRWLAATGGVERDHGHLSRVWGTFQDIEARHTTEVALRANLATSRHAEFAMRASQERMARLWERMLTAQDDERRRLARELHDHAGSALTSLLVSCKVLDSCNNADEAKKHAARLATDLSGVIDDLARLARGLHPAALDELGLGPALTRLSETTSGVHDFHIHTRVDIGDERLDADVELTIYRIAQEALTNVIKHADARNVWLACWREGDELCLRVGDDGRGYDARLEREFVYSSRLGLAGIRDRVALLGGRTQVITQPGAGTTVEVRTPALSRRGPRLVSSKEGSS
jgi:signal transduction histidine kinase